MPTQKLKKVIFVLSGSRDFPKLYARVVMPVMKAAKENGIESLAVPMDSFMMNWLIKQGVSPEVLKYPFEHTFLDHIFFNFSMIVIQLGFKFVRLWMRLLMIGYRTNIDRQSVKDDLKFGISPKLFRKLSQRSVHKIFQDFKPDCLFIIPDIEDWAYNFIDVAHKFGVPSLTASCTMIDNSFPHGILRADKVAVAGEAFKQIYLGRGNHESRVEVTGMAYFDGIIKRNLDVDHKLLRRSGINPEDPFILFATENNPMPETRKWLLTTLRALNELHIENLQLLVKVHPREREQPYEEIIDPLRESLSYRVVLSKDVDLYAALSQCTLVIGGYSTCLWESMIWEKPIIQLNYKNSYRVPYDKFGAALKATNFDAFELKRLIESALFDAEISKRLAVGRQKFLEIYSFKVDGKSSERILEVMEKLKQK